MSTISASTTSTTGFKVTSDTTGTLVFQTGASPTTAMSISSSQVISFTNPPTATGAGSVASNTAFGTGALAANTTGSGNSAFGASALLSNQGGAVLAAFGTEALKANTSGNYNVAFAPYALTSNTTGASNTAIGVQALQANTTASNNVAVGYQAGYSNQTGNRNTFIGDAAGYNSTAGSNTAIGKNAGYAMTTGSNNTLVGGRSDIGTNEGAGFQLTTGSYNNFFGGSAGGVITTGSKNTILGNYTGNQGGLDIRTSSNYIVLSDGDGNPRAFWDGNGTGYSYSASSNAFNIQYTGSWASGNANFVTMYMPNMSGGTAGIALGRGGGTYNTSKIIFGYSGSNSTSNYLGLGFWDADSRLTIYPTGNATLTGSLTQNSSDQRLKTDVIPISGALAKVCLLRGFTYNWNDLAFELNHLNREVREVGVFAQDVKDVLPEAVFIAPFDQERGNPSQSISGEEYLTVQYEKLTPLLIEAIKELKAEFDALKGQA